MGWTARGLYRRDKAMFHGSSFPTQFYIALCVATPAPTVATVTLGQLTQIATGNGYTNGGIAIARNTTDFATLTENAAQSRAEWLIKNEIFMASGGTLPASGSGAYWAVLTDANATVANREVWMYWTDGSAKTVSDGQPLTIVGAGGRNNAG
jgi:hypothetical protein